MARHEYRTAKAVTVAGILSGAGFALLGLVEVSSYFQYYRRADPWALAIGIAGVLAGVALIVELIRGRVLVVTDEGMSGFRNLRPMVITWPSVRSFGVGYLSSRSLVSGVWVPLRQFHAARGTRPPELPKPPPAPPLPPPTPSAGSIGKTLW